MKLTLLILLLLPNLTFALSGLEIAQKVYGNNREPYSRLNFKMTLSTKNGAKKEREFYLINSDLNKNDSKNIIVFTLPKKFNKTSMLTHNHPGKDSDQWLYLPALKKTRRISSSKKNGRFVSSDLTYEDLQNREPERDNHKILKEQKKGNQTIYTLQSITKDKNDSQYSKTISKIDSSNWTILSTQFYKNSKLYKTLVNKEIKKHSKIWLPSQTIIKNLKSKTQTVLELISTNFKDEYPERIFSKNTLENQMVIKKYLK